MVSHRNLYHVGRSMALELRMGPDDTGIIPVPMFHASGAVVLLNGVYSGNTSVIMPRWHVLEFVRLVAEFQVTRITSYNVCYTKLLRLLNIKT